MITICWLESGAIHRFTTSSVADADMMFLYQVERGFAPFYKP